MQLFVYIVSNNNNSDLRAPYTVGQRSSNTGLHKVLRKHSFHMTVTSAKFLKMCLILHDLKGNIFKCSRMKYQRIQNRFLGHSMANVALLRRIYPISYKWTLKLLTIGSMFSSCLSLSPCSKNSVATSSAICIRNQMQKHWKIETFYELLVLKRQIL